MPQTEPRYFHCYATANDSTFFLKDLRNLLRIKVIDSGVGALHLYIAVSQVKKAGFADRFFEKTARTMFRHHPRVTLVDIVQKGNVGRDFSSYEVMLHQVNAVAASEDYILFQNRSGYGPFRTHWYRRLIEQFEKFGSAAICGSTINFKDHPSRSERTDLPHVQTYAFLTKKRFMAMLGETFPGAKETERNKIITQGEIGLSQFFLQRNYGITCMEWPGELITKDSSPVSGADVKKAVCSDHAFYHRRYFRAKRIPKLLYLSLMGK